MTRSLERDLLAASLLAAAVAAPNLANWTRGLVPFWGDLGYLHHPWRAFEAQLVLGGRLPLWDPYLYFGMPAAAALQSGTFSPASALFFLFPFPAALEAFSFISIVFAGWLTYLWLRAARLAPSAALLGGVLVCLGGVFLENRQFPNHLAALAFVPAMLLCVSRPPLLTLSLALSLLAGYPPIAAGGALLAFALAPARARREGFAAAALAAAALCGLLLLPGAELWANSRRAGGVAVEEAVLFAFSPRDLLHWLSPLSVWWERFDPSGRWWTCCFVGYAAAVSAALGVGRLAPRRAAALAALIGVVILLTLGASNPVSRAAWAHLPPLRFVRYPGNLTFLALWPVALLAACGMTARTRWLALAAVVELWSYSWGSLPVAPASIYGSRGPLVARLQGELGGDRYLMSPRALGSGTGAGPRDWSQRLYGLMNAPFRLRAAGSFGEPLVPRASFEVQDRVFSASSAAGVAGLLPWLDARLLLTPEPLGPVAGLRSAGTTLWAVSRGERAVAPASFFPEPVPAHFEALGKDGVPLPLARPREDRYEVSGESAAPGWVYVSEPLYPGWRTRLDGREVEPLPAMTAFQQVRVPAGRWRLTFRYDPSSWRLGLALTLLALALLASEARRRLRGQEWLHDS